MKIIYMPNGPLLDRLRDKKRLRAKHGLSGWVLAEEALLKEAADEIERLGTENAELRRLLARYRDETPLGHQPHMIVHQVDEALRGKNGHEQAMDTVRR